MIENHIKNLLSQNLSFSPTQSQKRLINGLSDYITKIVPDEVFIIKGYAGTGKTTMIFTLTQTLNALKIKSMLMAPTGRAAKVMAGYTGQNAFTIHKKIYRQKSSSDGMGRFVLDKNLHKNTYFIVDEASMISNEENENSIFGSGKLLDDLLEYVYSGENCRLILVGDTAQLPPIGINMSPALDVTQLKNHGFSVKEFYLEDVVRQEKDSGILYNATKMRNLISNINPATGFLKLDLNKYPDIQKISGGELTELIDECYHKYGIYETTVVTRSNKRANLFNKGIRGSILYKENEIEVNDLLMVVRNNYFWNTEDSGLDFIANGDTAEIVKIYNYEDLYNFRFANVCLRFADYDNVEIDCKIFLDTLAIDTAAFSYDKNRELFEAISEDYADIKNKKKRWDKVRENAYFNALQVKYAYALTCHKAQGGQWKAVFIDHGYLTEEMLDTEYYRWLYTAFTRPIEKLFLVNFNKKFFQDYEEKQDR